MLQHGWRGVVSTADTSTYWPVHWVGVEPMTLRDVTSGRTTTPVEIYTLIPMLLLQKDSMDLYQREFAKFFQFSEGL